MMNTTIPAELFSNLNPDSLAIGRPNWVEGTRMGSRQDIASYYAHITAIDDQVGRLLRTLKELNLDENTIIDCREIFYSIYT